MSRKLIALSSVAMLLAFGGAAYAQGEGPQAGQFEIFINPVGGVFWTDGNAEAETEETFGGPGFGQYQTAVSATWHVNRYWGIEGEFAGAIGVEQRLTFPNPGVGSIGDVTPPSSLSYSGNVVVYPWTLDRSWAPYVTGGLGGLTLLQRNGLTGDDHTFFTTNLGGGLKYYWSDRWGIRGDYRFLWIDGSGVDAPQFFGRGDDRYGHRVSAGVTLKLKR